MEISLKDLKNKTQCAFDAWLDLNEKIPEKIRSVVENWLLYCMLAVECKIKREEDSSLD